jgi:hypothetical protein
VLTLYVTSQSAGTRVPRYRKLAVKIDATCDTAALLLTVQLEVGLMQGIDPNNTSDSDPLNSSTFRQFFNNFIPNLQSQHGHLSSSVLPHRFNDTKECGRTSGISWKNSY